jgi:hypothetical protein
MKKEYPKNDRVQSPFCIPDESREYEKDSSLTIQSLQVLHHTSGRAVFRFRRMATGPASKVFPRKTGLRHAETGAEPPDSNQGVGPLLNAGGNAGE